MAEKLHDVSLNEPRLKHDDFIRWLKEASGNWAALGEKEQAKRVMGLARKWKNKRNCPICRRSR